MNKNNYKKLTKYLIDDIYSLNLSKEKEEKLLASVDAVINEFVRYNKYIDLNFDVYEAEKEILLNHFIEKDDEVNKIYTESNQMKLELARYKKTVFYKVYNLLRKVYRKFFKRTGK